MKQHDPGEDLREAFLNPPASVKPRPLWFWNGTISNEESRRQIAAAVEAGYAGFGIVASHDMDPAFMSPAYLDRYTTAVAAAAEHGATVCLYDDFWFPTGSASGEIAREHPYALSKRLDLHATDVSGETRYSKLVPPGKLMSAVAMNLATLERRDLRPAINDGWLRWLVPEGRWRIMFFCCTTDGAKGLIDYLDPDAVDTFLSCTYDRYFETLKEYFGSTIDMAFHDETTFHWVEGGRAWTPSFNQRFEQQHGFDPAMLYPALWFDIGDETTRARNLLFAYRATLFAESFVAKLQTWCTSHGITLTGHVDQEEIENPVGLCGDLMRYFEHQDIPAFDQIFFYGRSHQAAKVVSSAATNYDRALVMCECYGVQEQLTDVDLYREAIDLFVRGANVLIPHALWYTPETKDFPPDLSPHDPYYGPHIADYNAWVARTQLLLQRGRPVVDIGVLYPIHTLQAAYRFGAGGDPYEGGLTEASGTDYLALVDTLVSGVRRDFSFVHPDVLNSRCDVDAGVAVGAPVDGHALLRLNNDDQRQAYRAFILPGCAVIDLDNLKKIEAFCDAGGLVIATRCLPARGTKSEDDETVRTIVDRLFRVSGDPGSAPAQALFLPDPTTEALAELFKEHLPVGDVVIDETAASSSEARGDSSEATGRDSRDAAKRIGHLSYQHRKLTSDSGAERDVFFVGNSSNEVRTATMTIRGHHALAVWDPINGAVRDSELQHAEVQHEDSKGQPVTQVALQLDPVRAIFLVSN